MADTYVYRGSNTEVSHDYLRPCVDRFLRDAAYGSVLLDMGCGSGSFIAAYRSKGSGWKLYGTDSSTTGIQIAKEMLEAVRPMVQGVQLSGRYTAAAEVIASVLPASVTQ